MFARLKEHMMTALAVFLEFGLPLLVMVGIFYGFVWVLVSFLNLIGFDISMASVGIFFGYTFLGFGGIGLLMFMSMASKGGGNVSGLMLLPVLGSGLFGFMLLMISG